MYNLLFIEKMLPPNSNLFLSTLIICNVVISIILFICYFHQNFYLILAIFTKAKKYKTAQKEHKFGILICAHDEEEVIGNLILSIKRQNYSQNKIKIFVCADNCKDKTANIAESLGAIVFERTSNVKGKSYALDFSIKKIIKYYKEDIEALFIFDADNILDPNYLLEMNKVFAKNYLVATSYRASKNVGKNWLTAGSSYMFYREGTIIHHSREALGLGTYVSGTGFYIAMSLLKELGSWPYHTITEDIEFSVDCAQKNIKIAYNENAIFYDEQPEKLKDSIAQRLRWCKGMHECYKKYGISHFKRTVKAGFGLLKFEMFVHISPLPILAFIWSLFALILQSIAIFTSKNEANILWFYNESIPKFLLSYLFIYFMGFFNALIIVFKKGKYMPISKKKQILYCFTFPLFMALFIPISIVALFKKVRWVKIPHFVNTSIDKL